MQELERKERQESAFTIYSRDGIARIESSSVPYFLSKGFTAFGRSSLLIYRIVSGVPIPVGQDYSILSSDAHSVNMVRKEKEITVNQKIYFTQSGSLLRRVSLANNSANSLSVRILFYVDVCASVLKHSANIRGCAGVNAFNRGTHVVIDEVLGDAVRIVGCSSKPNNIYMTDKQEMVDKIISTAKVPGSTLGISSYPVIVFENELEINGESQVSYSLCFSKRSMEECLRNFSQSFSEQEYKEEASFYCSDSNVERAFDYALAALAVNEASMLDRAEIMNIRNIFFSELSEEDISYFSKIIETVGYIPFEKDLTCVDILLCSLLLNNLSLIMKRLEKRERREKYRIARKISQVIIECIEHNSLASYLPSGWRRAESRFLPNNSVLEVYLAVAGSLFSFSEVASQMRKTKDSVQAYRAARFILDFVNSNFLNKERDVAVYIDKQGNKHFEDCIDKAVALYRFNLDSEISLFTFRRMLESDFETGYGPRTVPSSNKLYFNTGILSGQIGGYWTRAAISHCILGYSSGASYLASHELASIAKLVCSDVQRYKGTRGQFPYWIDTTQMRVGSSYSDPVSASRFIEALLFKEIGMNETMSSFSPCNSSKIDWLFLNLPKRLSLVVFRENGNAFLISTCCNSFDGLKYERCTINQASQYFACTFEGSAKLIFLGLRGQRKESVELPLRQYSQVKAGKADVFNARSETWEEMRYETKGEVLRIFFPYQSSFVLIRTIQ